MCLGIPMQVTSIDGYNARCEVKGVQREVNLFLMQADAVVPGDYVLVHVGYAIQKVSEIDARSSWELFDAVLQAREQGGDA